MQNRPQLPLVQLSNYVLAILIACVFGVFLASSSGALSFATARETKPSPTPMELDANAIGGVPDTSNGVQLADVHAFTSPRILSLFARTPQPLANASPEPGATATNKPTTTEEPKLQVPQTPAPAVAVAHAAEPTYILPIRYKHVSRGIIRGVHTGIDFVADSGSQVVASREGEVIEADSSGWNGGWGKYVLIQHADGDTTRYAHMSKLQVSKGQHVAQGDQLGLSGSTGRSTGPHLHFELRVNGRPVNPF